MKDNFLKCVAAWSGPDNKNYDDRSAERKFFYDAGKKNASSEIHCKEVSVTDCLKKLIADTDGEEVICLLQMITRKEI
jgi:hypothetical protein